MCLFITGVVPRTALTDALSLVAKRHRLSFEPCENPLVAAQLRSSEQYVHATASYCDCGSPLFFADKSASPQSVARQVAKLRKKKWSEAKIRKWLAAKAPRPDDPNASPDTVRSLNEWAAFLEEALRLPKVPYIGVIGHWEGGDGSNDAFTLAGRLSHTVADLRSGQLGVLEEDVIHEFRLDATSAG